jgi:ketosteroid isomerase-like protein
VSQENVQIVRRVYEAVARRDAEAVLALYDPKIEFDLTRIAFPGLQGIYRGHEGLRTWFRAWYEAWETLENVVEELSDAGEGVISRQYMRARGRTSGVDLEGIRTWAVWTIQDGRISRVAWYPSREEALTDLGPASEAPEPGS